MASPKGALYVGMTNNLLRRASQHKSGEIEGFSKEYGCKKLVYFESGQHVKAVIAREKQIKNWRRDKKEFLIKQINPHWKDLSAELLLS